MPTMDELLHETAEKGASDLHLSAGLPPILRVNGDLARSDHPVQTAEEVGKLAESIMSEELRKRFAAPFAAPAPPAAARPPHSPATQNSRPDPRQGRGSLT